MLGERLLDRLLYCLGSFISLGVLLLDLLLLFLDGDLEVRLEGGVRRGDLDLFFLDFFGDRDLFFRGDLLLDRDLDRGIVKKM